MKIMKRFFSAVWQFCNYLFVPQWGKKREVGEERKFGGK